ncbi:hypothetical protein RSAG8_03064, partial [Rhizoctonia solani AG-8 WAC10335]
MQFNLVKTKAAAATLITADRIDFCDLNKPCEQRYFQTYCLGSIKPPFCQLHPTPIFTMSSPAMDAK